MSLSDNTRSNLLSGENHSRCSESNTFRLTSTDGVKEGKECEPSNTLSRAVVDEGEGKEEKISKIIDIMREEKEKMRIEKEVNEKREFSSSQSFEAAAQEKRKTDHVCALEKSSTPTYDQISPPPPTLSPEIPTAKSATTTSVGPCPLSIKKSRLKYWEENEGMGKEKGKEVRVKEESEKTVQTAAAPVSGKSSSHQQSTKQFDSSNLSNNCNATTVATTSAVTSSSSSSSSSFSHTKFTDATTSQNSNQKILFHCPPPLSLPPPPLLRRQTYSPSPNQHHVHTTPSDCHQTPDYNFNPQTDTESKEGGINNGMKNDEDQTPVSDSLIVHSSFIREKRKCTVVGTVEESEEVRESEESEKRGEKVERENDEGHCEGGKEQPKPPPPPSILAPGPGAIGENSTVAGGEEVSKVSAVDGGVSHSLRPPPPSSPSSTPNTSIIHRQEQTQQNLYAKSADIDGHQNNSSSGIQPTVGQKFSTGHSQSSQSISRRQEDSLKVAPGQINTNGDRNYFKPNNLGLQNGNIVIEGKVSYPSTTFVSTSNGRLINHPTSSSSTSGYLLKRNESPATSSSGQIYKLKRFLTTLHQFSISVSATVGQTVHELIHAVVNSRITIEDFHRKIPEVTGYPLRPYVVPFLRLHLPLLQTELSRLYSQSLSRAQVYSLSPSSRGGTVQTSVTSLNSLRPSTQVRCGSYSNFVRSHESLFLQPTTLNDLTTHIFNHRFNPSIPEGSSNKVLQLGANTYYRPNREPIDQITAQVDKLICEPFEGLKPPSFVTHTHFYQPIDPRSNDSIRHISNQQHNFQQQAQVPTQRLTITQSSPNYSTLNSQTISSSGISMGIKDDQVLREGLKRKLHSPIESRKENEKSNVDHGKSDHLRVSSGPRKIISPPVKINYTVSNNVSTSSQQPSSTIHYLPNTTTQSISNNLFANQTESRSRSTSVEILEKYEDVPKKMKTVNEQLSPSRTIGSTNKEHLNVEEPKESNEEWNNIYVMLNCILGMVEKTKKALSILESRQTGKKSTRESINPLPVTSSCANTSSSMTIGSLIGAAIQRASASGSLSNGSGFNNSSSEKQHVNWNSQEQGPYSLVQSSCKSSRPSSCSSSSAAGALSTETAVSGTMRSGVGATNLVPSSSSMNSNKVGSFAPLSSTAYCNSTSTVVSPRTLQHQLSPPGQQSLTHTRSSSSTTRRSPLHVSPPTSSVLYYNSNSLLTSAGQGAAVVHRHPSFDPVEFKRQAEIAAEMKAGEAMAVERMKMERMMIEAKRRAAEELVAVMNKQEDTNENCWNCGRSANETCSGCNQARYCGSFCQHKHWDIHHRTCGRSSKSPHSTRSISP